MAPEVTHLVPRDGGRVRTALCGARGGATIGECEREANGYAFVTSNPMHCNCAKCLRLHVAAQKVKPDTSI